MPRVKRLPTWSSFLILHQVLLILLLKQHSDLSIYLQAPPLVAWTTAIASSQVSISALVNFNPFSKLDASERNSQVKLLCLFSLKTLQ